MSNLSFERPLKELRKKIEELKRFTDLEGIDFSEEIEKLEQRAQELEFQIYGNLTPWQKTQISRLAQRPTTLEYVERIFTDFIELHGDRNFGDDHAIVGGIAKFNGVPVTVIGHQKGRDTKENIYRNFGMPHPEGYRKALRLMEQANKFKRPIICFIDTPGAYPGLGAEERGQSEAIARNLREMASFDVPMISIVIGEGGSGGALALGVGNYLYMLENSIYSVISPEGAATILWRDGSKAEIAANTMKITSDDLLSLGISDGSIPEPKGGAHNDVDFQSRQIKKYIERALKEMEPLNPQELVEHRYKKFRMIGEYISII